MFNFLGVSLQCEHILSPCHTVTVYSESTLAFLMSATWLSCYDNSSIVIILNNLRHSEEKKPNLRGFSAD